jgi:hypothetical protein
MRNYLKIVPIGFISLLLISFASVEIYTEQLKQKLVDRIVEYYYPHYGFTDETPKLRPIHLYNFLSGNIHIHSPASDPEDNWEWSKEGIRYPEYKKIWRDVVAKNPDLLFSAWDVFGEDAILALNSKLNYYSKNNIEGYEQYYNNGFNTIDFWKVQKAHHQKYNLLIEELLMLEDKKLNFFINSSDMEDDALSYDFSLWLNDKKLLDQSYEHIYFPNNPEKPNNCYMYPGDLILLTKRICIDYPQWSPRMFLTECKRFNTKVLNSINTLYPN